MEIINSAGDLGNENAFGVDPNEFPQLYRKTTSMSSGQVHKFNKVEESCACLFECLTFLKQRVNDMNLADKDVLILIGPSRAGKGTLLSALQGNKMKLVDVDSDEESEVLHNAATSKVMAPVDDDNQPIKSDIISHLGNSHTFVPSLVFGP